MHCTLTSNLEAEERHMITDKWISEILSHGLELLKPWARWENQTTKTLLLQSSPKLQENQALVQQVSHVLIDLAREENRPAAPTCGVVSAAELAAQRGCFGPAWAA